MKRLLLLFAMITLIPGLLLAQDYTDVTITTTMELTTDITVSGTWTNNGTFTHNNNLVTFDGGSVQSINGTTSPTEFHSLTLNNSAGLVLNSAINVTTALTLTSGNINMNGQLTLSSGATLSGSGLLTGSGNISITEDIGTPTADNIGGLGLVVTSATNMGSTDVARFHTAQTGELGGGNSIKRYYTIVPTTNTGLNATIVFNYDDSELNGLTEATLVLWSSADGTTWTYAGGTLDATANTVTLSSLDGLAQYYTLGKSTPTVTTAAITSITGTTASSGGEVTAEGGSAVTPRGVVWSKTTAPALTTNQDGKTINGGGTGVFTSSITGLANGTTYYVRAYATNGEGTSYGNEVIFATLGASGDALTLDGADDYVTVGDISNSSTTEIKTIEFWINPTTTTEEIIDLNGVDKISVSSGTISVSGSTEIYVNGVVSTTLTNSEWQHVTITITAGYDVSALVIGSDGTDYLTGFIDEVRFWSTVRTQDEIRANMCRQLINPADENLVAYYQFNGNYLDASANTNDGTVQGGATTADDNTFDVYAGDTWLDGGASANVSFEDDYTTTDAAALDNIVISSGKTVTVDKTHLVTANNNLYTFGDVVVNPTDNNTDDPGMLTVEGNLDIETGGSLTLESPENSGASGSLIVKGTATGDITAKRFLRAWAYHYISAPVQGANTSVFASAGTNVLSFNQAGNFSTGAAWEPALNTAMTPVKGYAVYSEYATPEFTGALNTTNTITVTKTANPDGVTNHDGWNLVGNPFTSAIDWKLVMDNTNNQTNIENTVYMYEEFYDDDVTQSDVGNYRYFVAATGTNAGISAGTSTTNQYVPAMQGFFVRAKVDKSTFTVPTTAKAHSGRRFYKDAPEEDYQIRLSLCRETLKDETVIREVAGATLEHDGEFDAFKMFSTTAVMPQVFSLTPEGTEHAIYTVNEFEQGMIIPLGVSGQAGIEQTLSADKLFFETETDVYLVDKHVTDLDGNFYEQKLNDNPTYAYTHTADGVTTDRFELHFSPSPTACEEISTESNIYANGNSVFVNFGQETGNATISIFDLSGRVVMTKQVSANGLVSIPTGLNGGAYIVKVVSNGQTTNQKVFLK